MRIGTQNLNVPELRDEAEESSKSKVDFAGWGQVLMTCL